MNYTTTPKYLCALYRKTFLEVRNFEEGGVKKPSIAMVQAAFAQ
jgi:hypothetical protein